MIHNFTIRQNKLYIGAFSAKELIEKYGSSLYVYDVSIIRRQYRALVNSITYPKLQLHYACKANTNPEIMRLLRKEGACIEVMSPGEIALARKAGFTTEQIDFTSSNITKEELAWLIEQKITVNLDSLTQLQRWGELSPSSNISLRINQGIGASTSHDHWITGGPKSKFGIDVRMIDEAKALAQKYNLHIVGLHQHIGSDILDEKIFIKAMQSLLTTAKTFSHLKYLDFGGGFGVAYKETDTPLNMKRLGELITQTLTTFMQEYGEELLVKFEPGRYLVAESGVLLAKVTEIKRNPERTFVGIDSGFNQLIRPAMYGSYQQVVNASSIQGEEEVLSLAGNVCESGDQFARDRTMRSFQEDDICAILDAGAYGYSMSSRYNMRSQPAEVLVDGKRSRLIRKRQDK